jgi:lipoprotein-anchoring transpeptidase ErfK/SrfK
MAYRKTLSILILVFWSFLSPASLSAANTFSDGLVSKAQMSVEPEQLLSQKERRLAELEELDKLREAQLKMQQERIAAVQKEKARQITAHIDLSRQRMMIYKGDTLLYKWPVSTVKRGYVTPVGVYQPQYLERMHYSRRYHNSPMPHSIFFKGNFAIHGTNSISRLGRRASHGCVRLHPKHARKLYALVRKFGKKNTMIKITY